MIRRFARLMPGHQIAADRRQGNELRGELIGSVRAALLATSFAALRNPPSTRHGAGDHGAAVEEYESVGAGGEDAGSLVLNPALNDLEPSSIACL